MPFHPRVRMRRNRRTAWLREMVAETNLGVSDLIWPVFVVDGKGVRDPVAPLPGVDRVSVDVLPDALGPAINLGIPGVAIFPYMDPALKTPGAEEAFNPENLVCQAVKAVKAAAPDIGVICDVALDPFNSDGHDGLVRDGRILNDETIEVLCKQSLVQAAAGCDVIAPSDMMDGRVGAIRDALDSGGFEDVAILAYSVKYASCFYGPFRDAVGSGGALTGDKKTYQMDPRNEAEGMREVQLDLDEGADMVMVKPGLPYLDMVAKVKKTFQVPTFAYHVSGEYAMWKAAAGNGWLDNDKAILEIMASFKRAGADGVLTYAAVEVAKLLKAG